MPTRNTFIIIVALVACIGCYTRAGKLRYASIISLAIAAVTERYVEPVDKREMFENAMTGLVNGLDENCAYFPPADYEELRQDLDQEFVGIGVEVAIDPASKHVLVISPLFNSPAYHAGIRAGDLIVSVEFQDTAALSIQESINLMKGPPGSTVRLQVLPYGNTEPRTVQLKRQRISVVSLRGDSRNPDGTWNYVLESQPNLGYIRIDNFGENTANEFSAVMADIQDEIDGLILDVRDNPGGLLSAARDLCNAFVDEGAIVTIRGRGGEIDKAIVADHESTIVAHDLPVVILVNGLSASASEILAACLQDHDRAAVVGQRSWGKGTVQQVFPFEGGRSALKFTTHTYWRPSGKNIHRSRQSREEQDESGDWGVRPDPGNEVVVEMDEHRQLFLWRRHRDSVLRPDGNDQLPAESNTDHSPDIPSTSSAPEATEETSDDTATDAAHQANEMPLDEVDENEPILPVEDRQLNRAIELLLSRERR